MSCGNVDTEQVEVDDVLLGVDMVPEYSGCDKQRLRASALLRRSRGAEASWIGPEQCACACLVADKLMGEFNHTNSSHSYSLPWTFLS